MTTENKYASDAWAILIQDAQVRRSLLLAVRSGENSAIVGEENQRFERFLRNARDTISDLWQILETLRRSGGKTIDRSTSEGEKSF